MIGDFEPGTIISGRYRIESFLGKGGMGAIYRATDLLLGTPVALKFLLSSSDDHVEQLINEVRMARSITHPTICRVYDIGQMESLHYFTMELIEGEDLASLLRRIGRLSTDKVLDIGRQLCEGLAAAHSKGILHRDLKPANIMIDRDGQIKITDFGLATSMDWLRSDAGPIGTLLYMAPEQFSGGDLCERSDVYALGMVLYELITGRTPFEHRDVIGLYREKIEKPIVPPKNILPEVPESLQSVILKSLAPDPSDRPTSAIEVALLLPGVNPLHVAKQAGVTPKPEIVAHGEDMPWNTRMARWILMGLLPILLVGILGISDRSTGIGCLSVLKAPEIFADRCEQILSDIGYSGAVNWRDYGFMTNTYARNPNEPILFWYLQHKPTEIPEALARHKNTVLGTHTADARLLMLLDISRHLMLLDVDTPVQTERKPGGSIDWKILFSASGIDPDTVQVADRPPVSRFASERLSWDAGTDRSIRIDAAQFESVPVYYSVAPTDGKPVALDRWPEWVRDTSRLLSFPIISILVIWTIVLGVRNYREGRSDNLGGKRLFIFFFCTTALAWLLSLGHITHPFETNQDSGIALLIAWPVMVWLCFMALEPYARRHCAQTLIAWSRFLRGRFWDGTVGFSVLAGATFGSFGALLGKLDRFIPIWMGSPEPIPLLDIAILNSCLSTRLMTSTFLFLIPSATAGSIASLFILVLLYARLKSRMLSRVLFVVFFAFFYGLDGSHFPLSILVTGPLLGVLLLFVVFHFGLLTTIVGTFVGQILWIYPITLNAEAWFSEIGFMTLGFVLLIGIAGFLVAGRKADPDNGLVSAETVTRSSLPQG